MNSDLLKRINLNQVVLFKAQNKIGAVQGTMGGVKDAYTIIERS